MEFVNDPTSGLAADNTRRFGRSLVSAAAPALGHGVMLSVAPQPLVPGVVATVWEVGKH